MKSIDDIKEGEYLYFIGSLYLAEDCDLGKKDKPVTHYQLKISLKEYDDIVYDLFYNSITIGSKPPKEINGYKVYADH